MKVFVTGADGFIGSHLVESLVRDGHDVKALIQYNSFNSWGWLDYISNDIKESVSICEGDIRDYDFIEKVVAGSESVIHLAALISIPYSYSAPRSYVETNILGTLNVLSASLKHKISKFIHTSTSEVYGTAQYVPIDEKHPLVGQSPYAASKIGADQIAHSYFSSFGLPVITLRPFNTFGPRQSMRAVIPTIIGQTLKNTEVVLGATHPTRDFTYVLDTVDGFKAALFSSDINVGKVFNIGSNFEVSIKELVNLISEIMGIEISVKTTEERIRPANSEVERLYCNNLLAKNELKWDPNYSGLPGFKKGLQKTIEWFSDKENIGKYKFGRYSI